MQQLIRRQRLDVSHRRAAADRRRQSGAATLIVVMLLFFVVSLVAAYASRNLIFEQRTSANQYRSTQALEAAEAGLEWATAMLNGSRIGDDCLPTTDTTKDSFRERYLSTDTGTGVIVPRYPGSPNSRVWAACSFDGANWSCRCPTGSLAANALPAGRAAFMVRFVEQTSKPGMVRVEANGCNSFDLPCLHAETTLGVSTCRSSACAMLSRYSGAKAVPTAAVTARQGVGGSALAVYNQDSSAAGITIHSGVPHSVGSLVLGSLPGTPPLQSLRDDDPIFAPLPDDAADCNYCTFSTIFGLRPETYRRQQGTLTRDCSIASPCAEVAVNTLLSSSRGRVVYLSGPGGLTINDSSAVIGSAADPVVLVVEGPLVLTAAASTGARIHGLVYANSVSLAGGEIRGALISATTVTGANSAKVVYDGAALTRLRLTSGSFVRVPGSWRDFP